MSWKLTIQSKNDEKLLLNFPNDPFSDIAIQTATQELNLALAYLSIDSGYFSQIDPSTHSIHLKHLQQRPLIGVLQALYGGDLCVSSVQELDEVLRIIEYLDVQEFRENIQKGLIELHEGKPEHSPLLSIEMLQFCLKNNLIKEYICEVHFSSKLKTLESSKNYLQLGKLSKEHLNYILLKYLATGEPHAPKTINTILENYINRKSYRPAEYLEDDHLRPLKQVWEDFHHKMPITKAIKPLTKTYPSSSTRVSAFLNQNKSPQRQESRLRLQKLSTLPSFNIQSINLGLSLLKSDNVSEDSILDLRIEILEKENKEKNSKIKMLQEELRFLQEQVKLKKKKELDDLEDITLLQNVVRSRRSKEKHLFVECSLSTDQYAFLIERPSQDKDKPKSACKISTLFSKKTIFT